MTNILYVLFLLISAIELPPLPENEIQCLADNIYFEARGEETIGRIAIASVTLNRVNSAKFPDSICKVVKQKNDKYCQFSWYCDGKSDIPKSKNEYDKALDLSSKIWYSNMFTEDPTDGALFYHNDTIEGLWFKRNLKRTVTIGSHIFYK